MNTSTDMIHSRSNRALPFGPDLGQDSKLRLRFKQRPLTLIPSRRRKQ